MKSPGKIVKIIELRAKGLSMEDIGKELGITRQTVSAYLRTPEAQAIATELQESLLSTLKNALTCVDTAIKQGNAKIARDIAVNLGKMVLAQTPQATESKEKLSSTDRQALIDSIRNKLAPKNNIPHKIDKNIGTPGTIETHLKTTTALSNLSELAELNIDNNTLKEKL